MTDREGRHSDDNTDYLSNLEKDDAPNMDSTTYEGIHSPMSRTITNRTSHSHAHMEASDFVNLPYRTFSSHAAVEEEYIDEHPGGQVLREVQSHRTGKTERYELVTWTINDPENPKNWSVAYKWYCTMVVALTCFVVAFNSAVITADIQGPARTFHVSEEVSLLPITVFVIGFGVGKLSNHHDACIQS